jgi:hypothetical protein
MLPAFVDWMHGIQQTPFQRHAQLLSFFNCILESFWVPEKNTLLCHALRNAWHPTPFHCKNTTYASLQEYLTTAKGGPGLQDHHCRFLKL